LNVVKETAAKFPGHPLILVGKSMGSRYISSCVQLTHVVLFGYVSMFNVMLLSPCRVSCMVSAVNEDVTVSAVICLGYPLKV